MAAGKFDVRAVANVVLDEARQAALDVTNLHLNKILYFMYVDFLRDTGCSLVSAKIEAWDYGPVFREIYNQFKSFGRKPISTFALRVDFQSGERVVARESYSDDVDAYIRRLANFYIRIPAGILVDMSHAKGGAWDKVWHHEDDLNVGMEITDDLIREFEMPSDRRIRMI